MLTPLIGALTKYFSYSQKINSLKKGVVISDHTLPNFAHYILLTNLITSSETYK